MGTLKNTEVMDFTAGINNVIAPHLMATNEALELTNVDIKAGSLKSITSLGATAAASDPYFTEYRSKLYYYPNWRSNALIDDKLYWSDGTNTGKILPDGTELALGITTPITALSQGLIGAIGTGTHKGDFKYTYTFYSTTTGVESAPAPLPPYVIADEQNIQVSGFETLPTDADRYRIYRIGGYLTRFTLVATVAAIELPYVDSLDETLIDGRLLQTLRAGVPPARVQNFVELNGRLFGSVENKVYFSGLGNPDSWYTADFFNLPDTVVALAKVPAGLLVMGNSYVYLLFGASPTTFRVKVISDYLGCINNKSIAYYNERVIWLGVDGVLTSDGYSIQNLTYRKIDRISSMQVSSAEVANDVYYMLFKPVLIPSSVLVPSADLLPGGVRGSGVEGGSTEGLIAMDFRRGDNYSYHHFEYLNALSLGIFRGELYAIVDGTKTPILCEQKIICSEPFCLGDKILTKVASTPFAVYKTLYYTSPKFINDSYSTLKEYDKVRINFRGQFDVSIIFDDGVNIITEKISSPTIVTNDANLEGEADNVAIIGIPNSSNKAYSIQFKVSGKGSVRSIQYSWSPRELA